MRSKTLFTAVAGVALLAGTALAQSKPTVAVLPFTNSALGANNKDLDPLSKGVADLLISSLASNTAIRVVERDQIQKILDEQKLSSDGKLDQATAVKVGKIVGAHHMVTGVFVTEVAGGSMKITARVFNTETSEVEQGDFSATGKTTAVMPLIDALGAKINSGLKLPAIPAPARDAHEASAKKQEKVPFQAVMLYSKGLGAKDQKDEKQAVTLFRQAIAAFPDYEAPKKELEKLGAK